MIVPIMELIYYLLCPGFDDDTDEQRMKALEKACEVMVIVFHIDMNELIILMRLFKMNKESWKFL